MMEAVISDVIEIIEEGRRKAYQTINTAMIEAYWLAGKRIVEDKLEGRDRAEYGKYIIQKLSELLTARFGSGYSPTTLYNFKKFYTTFPDENILYTLCTKLSWSHNRRIMRVIDKEARIYYLKESAEQNWGVRQLERNINTLYYQRLISSQHQQPVKDEMQENTKEFQHDNRDFIRNPTVLEFLNIPINYAYTEKQLEQSQIIEKSNMFIARIPHYLMLSSPRANYRLY